MIHTDFFVIFPWNSHFVITNPNSIEETVCTETKKLGSYEIRHAYLLLETIYFKYLDINSILFVPSCHGDTQHMSHSCVSRVLSFHNRRRCPGAATRGDDSKPSMFPPVSVATTTTADCWNSRYSSADAVSSAIGLQTFGLSWKLWSVNRVLSSQPSSPH